MNNHHPTQSIQLFGIRHHGPGSASSLVQELTAFDPDLVLVEGPPDADSLLPLMVQEGMHPPVALLIYAAEAPHRAAYYPFAGFSPEWQALLYAAQNQRTARFFDLPQRYQLGPQGVLPEHPIPATEQVPLSLIEQPERDPIGALALSAGYSDGERWWEYMVEQRRSASGVFLAIHEAMVALREATPPVAVREQQREAWMRTELRNALAEGFCRIAVVCGAWHTPALVDLGTPEADAELLQGLVANEICATWVPWTYGRLALQSGYGAGIVSPGWYEHLWNATQAGQSSTEVTIHWITRIARLLRDERLDVSSAHIIEAVRLAESLATIRERPIPGLDELTEAAQAVFWFGSMLPMQLLHEQLIVGQRLGSVPAGTPLAPLQRDLALLQKRLYLPAEASWRNYDLDLRVPRDLERSQLLHRLVLLGVEWGRLEQSGGGKGTFREIWRLEWQPELAVKVIEAGTWGTTIQAASAALLSQHAQQAQDLPALTTLVQQALLADIRETVVILMQRIEMEAAVSSDVTHLMRAIPPLVEVLRYGSVRNTDTQAMAHVIQGLVTRVCIGLPHACIGLQDAAAEDGYRDLMATSDALRILADDALLGQWHSALGLLAERAGCHGLLAGRAVRLLHSAGILTSEQVARLLSVALSAASDPAQAAAWIEGFVRGSGELLVHDRPLWQLIDEWLMALSETVFLQVVPLLRRSFANFGVPERRAMMERARTGSSTDTAGRVPVAVSTEFYHEQGEAALAVIALVLGMNGPDAG
jgi:hypothetical protein